MSTETQNERTQRGHRAVELHPDLGPNGIDFETAATDVIADVLHALADAGLLFDDSRRDARLTAQEILDRALRTFEGDAEDDLDVEPLFSSEAQETFTPGSRVFKRFETGNYVGSEPTIEATYRGRVRGTGDAYVELANGMHEHWSFETMRNLYR